MSLRLGRRAVLAAIAAAGAGPALAQALPGSFENWRRLFGGPQAAADEAERRRLLAEGESLLSAGHALAAQDVFQRAALMMHAADTECSIVRAQVQAGQYRQALAFAAHAALAHRGYPGGLALYAWLLHLGGQSVIAGRLLDEAMARHPLDPALKAARERLALPWPRAGDALMGLPLRAAPYAHGRVAGPAARCIGTATLMPAGHRAVAPLSTIGARTELLLRNGLGTTVDARVAQRDETAGVAWLVLDPPLAPAPAVVFAIRPPFAGSPVATVEFGADGDGRPAWPMLRQGFAGRQSSGGRTGLDIALPEGPRGGPVFDRAGRLAGIGMPDAAGRAVLWPLHGEPSAAPGESGASAAESVPGTAQGVDVVYELALQLTLQVIADPAS